MKLFGSAMTRMACPKSDAALRELKGLIDKLAYQNFKAQKGHTTLEVGNSLIKVDCDSLAVNMYREIWFAS